ncbi:hypothetical protein F4779DRAFT_576207 [Xylariaceae sp. FL0662B]|nr:hypothetical protein F4779DRAFT_576207 [Xylariaceae sp. FL0662B]
MADTPSIVDLIGIYDNLNEPQQSWNYSGTITGTTAFMLVLSTLSVVYRLYYRQFIVRASGWDDFFVFLYIIFGLVGGICLCLSPRFGLGRHFVLLTSDEILNYLRNYYVLNAAYNMSTTFIKISLLFQYLRIFDSGGLRMACIVMLVATGLWGFVSSFMAWFPCFPDASGFWIWENRRACYAYGSHDPEVFFATYTIHAVINMALDLIVFAIPIPYYKRTTQRRTKIGLICLFISGAVINALCMWRVATMVEHRVGTSPTFDPTWYTPISLILGMLEVNIASICASVPIFWPALTARLDQIFVTREVKITSTQRYTPGGDDDDEIELHRNVTDGGEGGWKTTHSRAGSELSVSRLGATDSPMKGAQHYADDFILHQVDPFSRPVYAVESEVVSDGVKRKASIRTLTTKYP